MYAWIEGWRAYLRALWLRVKEALRAPYPDAPVCRHYQLRMMDATTADGQYHSCQYLRVWLECIDCGEWWFVQGRSPGPLAGNMRDANIDSVMESRRLLKQAGVDPREFGL